MSSRGPGPRKRPPASGADHSSGLQPKVLGWKETALAGAEGVAGRTEAGTDEAVDAGTGVGA